MSVEREKNKRYIISVSRMKKVAYEEKYLLEFPPEYTWECVLKYLNTFTIDCEPFAEVEIATEYFDGEDEGYGIDEWDDLVHPLDL